MEKIVPFVGIGPVVGIGLFGGTGPVVSLTYIFQVLYVLCFTRPRYQVSVYRTGIVSRSSCRSSKMHPRLPRCDPFRETSFSDECRLRNAQCAPG